LATSNKNFKVKNGLDVSGTATASSFVKTGGSSDEFLMADGSVSEGGGGGSLEVSQTPPASPSEGDIWYNSQTGQTFVYYDSFWVENIAGIAGPEGPTGQIGETGLVAQASAPASTSTLWLDTDEDGVGIPLGGTTGQVLAKIDSGAFNTEWVDIYTPAQTDSAIATAVSNLVDSAPTVLDTLNELSAALNDDPNFSTTVATALAALVPSGTVSQTARATAPTGYLLCDGSAISRTTYSSLFDAIGTAYGVGDNSTTFNIPNLKGRVPVGRDSAQTEFDTLGETSGAKTVSLSANNIPSHNHTGTTNAETQEHTHSGSTGGISANHTHGITTRAISGALDWPNTVAYSNGNAAAGSASTGTVSSDHSHSFTTGGRSATHNHTFTTSSVGGDGSGGVVAVNNLQPYVVLNYMIKI
jgi:microcystin-dependent protein